MRMLWCDCTAMVFNGGCATHAVFCRQWFSMGAHHARCVLQAMLAQAVRGYKYVTHEDLTNALLALHRLPRWGCLFTHGSIDCCAACPGGAMFLLMPKKMLDGLHRVAIS